jgi:DNA polymerase III subunit delta'
MLITLHALPRAEIERDLAQHCPGWNAKERALVARLSEGAVGPARSFDLAAYRTARQEAWVILNCALRGGDHRGLFQVTEGYRAGAEGREKMERLVRTLYSLLRDLMYLNSGTGEFVRNLEMEEELKKLAEAADFAWIAEAAERLAEVERGMRRNLQRSLSLDAFAAALERTGS